MCRSMLSAFLIVAHDVWNDRFLESCRTRAEEQAGDKLVADRTRVEDIQRALQVIIVT